MNDRYAEHEHTDFTGASLQALETPTLQTALSRLAVTLAAGNRAAWEKLPGSDEFRERARQIKDETLARLDELLVQVEQSVERAGGYVHWASTADDARRIVLEIAREHGVRSIVKSKSMTSEEIHLNPALEEAGIEVVETDFGEYIAQAAKQRPRSPGFYRITLGRSCLPTPERWPRRRGRHCERSSARPTWESPARISSWPRRARFASSRTRGTRG
jgi:hypothetical protein